MNLVAVNFSSKEVCVLCDTGNSGTNSMQAQTVAQNVSTCVVAQFLKLTEHNIFGEHAGWLKSTTEAQTLTLKCLKKW